MAKKNKIWTRGKNVQFSTKNGGLWLGNSTNLTNQLNSEQIRNEKIVFRHKKGHRFSTLWIWCIIKRVQCFELIKSYELCSAYLYSIYIIKQNKNASKSCKKANWNSKLTHPIISVSLIISSLSSSEKCVNARPGITDIVLGKVGCSCTVVISGT